jgi:dienelactone hydrolase
VRIWSNGVALDSDIYRPKGLGGDRRVPAVVLSHGWGGSKASGERYAAKFAAAGMVSLCFTHGGWGSSGSRVVLAGDAPALDDDNEGIANVRVIRELLDPLEWLQNFRCAIDYIEGEPNVDPSRIGAWGTSFGGGVAMHTAANDDRIKVLAVQVASLSVRSDALVERGKQRAIDMARGRIASVPQGIDGDLFPRLAGTPHLARLLQFDVTKEAGKLRIPTLMLDAEHEEFFDVAENCGKAYAVLKAQGAVPLRYQVVQDIDHYGIYFGGFEEGSDAALGWFSRYL